MVDITPSSSRDDLDLFVFDCHSEGVTEVHLGPDTFVRVVELCRDELSSCYTPKSKLKRTVVSWDGVDFSVTEIDPYEGLFKSSDFKKGISDMSDAMQYFTNAFYSNQRR